MSWHVAPHVIKANPDGRGYPRATIVVNGKRRYRYLHELILTTFMGPRPPGHLAAHLDGNPLNSAPSNLRWVTPRENVLHRNIHGTAPRGRAHWKGRLSDEDVLEIRNSPDRPKALAERFDVSARYIGKIRHGRERTHLSDEARERDAERYPHAIRN